MVKKNYQATFILDTREWRESIDQLIDGLKKTIEESNGAVTKVQNLGIQTFVRSPRRDFTQGNYICIQFETKDVSTPIRLKDRVRLNPNVNRIMIENLGK